MIIERLVSCGHRYKVATPELEPMKSEHRLMLGIIIRALGDATGQTECWDYSDAVRHLYQVSAQNWFNSKDHSAFSFAHCCEELGIDKKLFLNKVKKLIKEKTK